MKRVSIIMMLLLAVTSIASAQRYNRSYDDHTKFRFGAHGGWSYMTAKISSAVPADFRPYMKELKSGFHYGAEGSFFFTRGIGAGIRYSGFNTRNELNSIYIQDTSGKVRTGKMSDNISIQYIGPSFDTRYMTEDQRFQLVSTLSVGYMSYKNTATVIDDYTLTSSTLGVIFGLSFDYEIANGVFIGLDASLTGGSLSYMEFAGAINERVELPEDERENISRLDVGAGVRWNF